MRPHRHAASIIMLLSLLMLFTEIALEAADCVQDNTPPGYSRRIFEGEGPLVEVPAEIGGFAFGVVSYSAGLPLILVGDIFYFPFSGHKYFGDCIESSYYELHTFTETNVTIGGYYTLGAPCYLVKLLIWTGPVSLYEWTCGAAEKKDHLPVPTTPEPAPPERLLEHTKESE